VRTGAIHIDHEEVRRVLARLISKWPEEKWTRKGAKLYMPPSSRQTTTFKVRRPEGGHRQVSVHLRAAIDLEAPLGGYNHKHNFIRLSPPMGVSLSLQEWVDQLAPTLAHELAHSVDPQAARGASGTSAMRRIAYFNHPLEVNARLVQVEHELSTPSAVDQIRKLGPYLESPIDILGLSKTWVRASPYFYEETARKFFRMAARLVQRILPELWQ